MTQPRLGLDGLTAKQRLAVSRQTLVDALEKPLWASLLAWGINRYERSDESRVTTQSDQAIACRTPS